MKKCIILLLLVLVPVIGFAQFKSQTKMPSFSRVLTHPTNNLILGFINPDRLDMHHSFSMSYMTFGKQSLMVNSYMNTINYQISNPLWLRLNLGIMNSPYNSLPNSSLNKTQFFGGAELFYRPGENSLIRIGVDVRPGFYRPLYYDPWRDE